MIEVLRFSPNLIYREKEMTSHLLIVYGILQLVPIACSYHSLIAVLTFRGVLPSTVAKVCATGRRDNAAS